MPAIGSASLLVFIFCFTSFGVVLILGGPGYATLEVEIYRQSVQLFNLPMAAALSLIQIVEALREQWNDGANTLALKPGQVMGYRSNDRTFRALEENGVEVVAFAGSELVRGRGGARCMSMPIRRDEV